MHTSFRDPAGYIVHQKESILRKLVGAEGEALLQLLQNSLAITEAIDEKLVASYEVFKPTELKHPKVWFVSYPYEWSRSMFIDAGHLTLEIALKILDEQLGLKDATPYNVLFEGHSPLFVDLGSFEIRDPHDPVWLPLAQFQRMFTLPLLLNQELGIGFTELFLTHGDGVTPEYCARALPTFSPSTFTLVTLPTFLARYKTDAIYEKRHLKNPEVATWILQRMFKGEQKRLTRFQKRKNASHWSSYMQKLDHYSDAEFAQKEAWVRAQLQRMQPKALLDVGCNSGHFSKIAAEKKARVVSIDTDPVVIDHLYQEAKEENLDIQPLVVNLSRPSPSVGWNNHETFSFLERAEGKFDVVLMLAVLHHMLVTDRIPMEEVVALAKRLTTRYLLIEFVHQDDPKFVELTRGRALYNHLTQERFESAFAAEFSIESKVDTTPTRTLYALRR